MVLICAIFIIGNERISSAHAVMYIADGIQHKNKLLKFHWKKELFACQEINVMLL